MNRQNSGRSRSSKSSGARTTKSSGRNGGKKSSGSFKRDDKSGFKRSGGFKKENSSGGEKRSSDHKFSDRDEKSSFKKTAYKKDRPYEKEDRYDKRKSEKSYSDRDEKSSFKKTAYKKDRPFEKEDRYDKRKSEKSYSDRDEKSSFKKTAYKKDRPFEKEDRYDKRKSEKSYSDRDEKPSYKRSGFKKERSFDGEERRDKRKSEKSYSGREEKSGFKREGFKKERSFNNEESGDKRKNNSTYKRSAPKKSYVEQDFKDDDQFDFKKYKKEKKDYSKSSEAYTKLLKKGKPKKSESSRKNESGGIRLNKFIANTGLCSRREADVMIETGVIKVNGTIVSELGTKIFPGDKVMYHDQTLNPEKLIYVLLNKPKDYITTVDDPDKRKTVMELVKNAGKERIYPVGRLDRNTTGLLLFTNDGELTKKLTHPKYGVKKIYHVMTDQNVRKEDLEKMKDGVELEDGFVKVDDIQYVGDAKNKKDIGVEIHSGRNRIVRRLFEHFDYKVVKLDRVMFAGLTKKDLPRGKWRFLSAKEVQFLQQL